MGFREALGQREGGLGGDNNIQCVDITSTYSSWPQGADTATDGEGTGAQRRYWPKVNAGIVIVWVHNQDFCSGSVLAREEGGEEGLKEAAWRGSEGIGYKMGFRPRVYLRILLTLS